MPRLSASPIVAACGVIVLSLAVTGCATRSESAAPAPAPADTAGRPVPPASQGAQAVPAARSGATPATRIVKSRDGRFEGEMVGTPAPGSKFARLAIGMTMEEVTRLIGGPDNIVRHETGKRWIPFYYGNDAQRMQALYRGEGCLTYTAGNVFGGGGNELIRITALPSGACME